MPFMGLPKSRGAADGHPVVGFVKLIPTYPAQRDLPLAVSGCESSRCPSALCWKGEEDVVSEKGRRPRKDMEAPFRVLGPHGWSGSAKTVEKTTQNWQRTIGASVACSFQYRPSKLLGSIVL